MAVLPDPSKRDRLIPKPSMDVARYDAGIMGRGMEALGRSVASFGANVASLAKKEEAKIESAQADEAINKLRQKQLDLTMGTPDPQKGIQGGYVHQKEARVMVTPEGEKPFIERYLSQFTSARDEIGAGLSGRARERFDAFANNASLDFQMGLLRKATAESERYQERQFNETVDTEARAAGAAWDNPRAVVGSMQRVSEAAQRRAEVLGIPPESASQAALAVVHESVIDSALAAGTPEGSKFAEEHLNNFKATLPEKTLVSLHNRVQTVRKQHIALDAADYVSRAVAPKVMPSEFERAAMNVPDRQAFAGLLKETGGDLDKAWAASVAGKKALQEAVKKEERNQKLVEGDPTVTPMRWLDFMPTEARAAVAKNRAAYEQGTAPAAPTLLEVREMAKRRVLAANPNATGDQIEAAQLKTEQWYNDILTARNQNQDRALLGLQQRVYSGEIKTIHDVKPQELAAIGDKRSSVNAYLNAFNAERDKVLQNDPRGRETYDRALSSPATLAEMPVAQIMEMASIIGKEWTDDLLARKADYAANPEKYEQAKIDADEFAALTYQFGIRGNSEQAVARRHFIRQRAEAEIGRLRSRGEKVDKEAIIAKYARQYVTEEGFFSDKKKYGYEMPGDPVGIIPSGDFKKMQETYKRLGVKMPTDPAELQSVYLRWKDAEQRAANTP